MTTLQVVGLKKDDPNFLTTYSRILDEEERKNAQYLGEGITFLALNADRGIICLPGRPPADQITTAAGKLHDGHHA